MRPVLWIYWVCRIRMIKLITEYAEFEIDAMQWLRDKHVLIHTKDWNKWVQGHATSKRLDCMKC